METVVKAIMPNEESAFKSDLLNFQNKLVEQWEIEINSAILRLALWNNRITTEVSGSDNPNGASKISLNELSFGKLLPAAKLLLNTARLSCDHEMENCEHVLMKLNDLLSVKSSITDKAIISAYEETIKSLFSAFSQNPYIIFAAIAIFDIHGDQYDTAPIERNSTISPLHVYPNMFRPIIGGLGIGRLLKRWDKMFYEFLEKDNFERKKKEFNEKQDLAMSKAVSIINDFNEHFRNSNLTVEFDKSPKQFLRYVAEVDLDHDLSNAIFLKITSQSEQKCYYAEAWVESFGEIQLQFLRKSFLQESENGTREFEIGVRLKKEDQLLIARIGTRETLGLSEWGRLLNVDTFVDKIHDSHQNFFADRVKTGKICVYKPNGNLVRLTKGSTIAEFINKEYGQRKEEVLAAFVNGFPVKFDQELKNGDLVDIVLKDECQCRLLSLRELSLYSGEISRQIKTVNGASQQERMVATGGRNRIMLNIQEYLAQWNLRIDEHQTSILLGTMHHVFGNSNLEEIYAQLVNDRTYDDDICQCALQYKMRGRIQLSGGKSLPEIYNWKSTKIAQCCKPKVGDEIVGSIWKSPKNPSHPAYERFHELKIHRKKCEFGPKENILALEWSSSDKHQYGFQIEVLISDAVGCLGEFINIFYNTNLTMHSVRADAINFHNKACITVHATAFIRDELELARKMIIDRYGEDSIKVRYLRNLEVAQLVETKKTNPYIISSEPELDKNLPILFFGRERELRKLIAVLHDHNTRCVLLNGYYRVGKTWFLKEFKTVFRMPKRLVVIVSTNNVQLSGNPMRNFVYEIYLQTLKAIENEEVVPSEILQRPQSFSELKIWFEKVSRITGNDFILLLDEFSVISDWEMNNKIDRNFLQLLRNFIFSVPKVSFVLVFQTAHIHNLVDMSSGFRSELFNYFRGHHDEEITLEPFNQKEICELITRPVSGVYQFSESALKLAYELCGGVPFIGALLGKFIWDYCQEKNLQKVNKQVLIDITRNIENYSTWNSYLDTLVGKLQGTDTFLVLRTLAVLEKQNVNQISAEIIQRELKMSLNTVHDSLNALEKAGLIETNQECLKMRGTLLSTYLANKI